MTDLEFIKNLPSVLHLSCIINFLKETPTYICLADQGIIHELAHYIEHGETDLSPGWTLTEVLDSDKYGNPTLGLAEKETEI